MLPRHAHIKAMTNDRESLDNVSEFLSRILEDRGEFFEQERSMAARSSRFEVLFKMLQAERWDDAFDVAWAATAPLKLDYNVWLYDNSVPLTHAVVLKVRNSGDHTLGREFAKQIANLMVLRRKPALEIAWDMLAADVDKPETILKFVPQLAYSFELEGADHLGDTFEYHETKRRLGCWHYAAEGLFKGSSTLSMFTLAVTGPVTSRDRSKVPPGPLLPNYQRAVLGVEIPDPEEVPGLVVMAATKASVLHKEQTQYKDLVGRRLPFAITPDLLPVRQKLLSQYPHAAAAIGLLMRDLRQGKPARISPVILVGPPGSGKSRLVRMFAEACGIGHFRFDASGIADSIAFAGTAKAWGHTQPCIPFRAISTTDIPNPILLIDEIDKAASGNGGVNGSLCASLTPFLESETSARHRDVSLDAEVDLSWISYISTANDDSKLPPHIKDRFRVIRMPAPTLEHLSALAYNIQVDKALQEGEDVRWIEPLYGDELEVAGKAWEKAKFSMRALQKIVSATVDARSAFAPRH
jgi:ATP-dependent Lon protease